MNGTDKGCCRTNNADEGKYNVGTDAQGNSRLTGDGAGKADGIKNFTATEIEVFSIQ